MTSDAKPGTNNSTENTRSRFAALFSRPHSGTGASDAEQAPGWSRRAFLGSFATIAAGAAVAGAAGGYGSGRSSDPAQLYSAPARSKRRAHRVGDADDGYTPQAPFTLTAAAELSEDYFIVQNHPIDPAKDKVIAYSRVDGTVEAIVLQDGVVKQLYRDPSQAGGWNAYALPDADGVKYMVSGISGPVPVTTTEQGAAALKVCYVTTANPDVLNVAVEKVAPSASSPATFTTTSIPWDAAASDLQIALNADNSLLVTAVRHSSLKKDAKDARLYYYADGLTADHTSGLPLPESWGYLTGFNYVPIAKPGNWAAVVARDATGPSNTYAITLYLPGTSQTLSSPTTVDILASPLQSGNAGSGATMADLKLWYSPVPLPVPNTQIASVEYLTVLGSQLAPTALIWTTLAGATGVENPRLWTLTVDGLAPGKPWYWHEVPLPAAVTTGGATVPLATALSPAPASDKANDHVGVQSFLDVFTLVDGTMHVLRQAPQNDSYRDATQPVYCPSIPLHPGVAVMTSQAGVSTGNELILVDGDDNMVSLEKDPVSGRWADAAVLMQLPTSELQQVPAYRVSFSLADAWGTALANQQMHVTASTPVTAMVDGAAVPLSQSPSTLTSDDHGMVVLALPADALSAPTLTVMSDGLSAPVTVYPSGAVNTYMKGGSSLNYQAPMSASTLQGARTETGKPLAPGAADNQTATTAVSNMSTAATWGAQGAEVGNLSTTVGRVDGTMARRKNGPRAHHGLSDTPVNTPVNPPDYLHDLNNWAHDVLHAIKKGAVGVLDLGLDVAKKTVTIVVDAAKWTENKLEIIVRGIEDAAHVLHAIFRKLLAYVVDAVKWLMAEVIELLRDTAALAKQYDQWLTQCVTRASGQLDTQRDHALHWLARERDTVVGQFRTAAGNFDKRATLGGYGSKSVSAALRSRRGLVARKPRPTTPISPAGNLLGASDSGSSTHSNWLFTKIRNEISGSLSVPALDLSGVFAALQTAADSCLADFTSAFEEFWNFLKDTIEHPADAARLGMRDLMLALADIVDGMFSFLIGIVSALTDLYDKIAGTIPDILATPLSSLPVLGKLLSLVGLGSVRIGTLISMIFAFPTVLAYKITHGGKGRPFDSSLASEPSGVRSGDVNGDLHSAGGVALVDWAVLDTISQGITATKKNPGMFFTAVDIASPIIVGFLTLPAADDGTPYFDSPIDLTNAGELNFLSWLLGILPAFNVAAGLYIDEEHKKDPAAPKWQETCLWLTSFCGLGALVTGVLGSLTSTQPNPDDQAIAVLSNMSNIIAPLLDDKFVKQTNGISAWVSMGLTGVCGAAAGIVYSLE